MEKQGFFSLVQQKWKGCTVLLSSFLFEKTEYCLIHLYSITSKNHSSQEIFINLQWQYYVVLKWEAILNSPFLPRSSGGTHKANSPCGTTFHSLKLGNQDAGQSWDHRPQASSRQAAGSSQCWQGDSSRAVMEAAAHPVFRLQHQCWATSRF